MLGIIEYMKERQAATDRRRAGLPPPWSEDPIIATKFFCNVVRDQDRTSLEARQYIETLDSTASKIAAMWLRLTNRVTSLRTMVESNAFSEDEIIKVLSSVSPVFCVSFKINIGGWWSIPGVARAAVRLRDLSEEMRQTTAVAAFEQINTIVGPFLSYQILQDLRWVWGPYPDEDEWAYIGPGAVRGLDRLSGDYRPQTSEERQSTVRWSMSGSKMPEAAKATMQGLLVEARKALPQLSLNLFEVEHNLCELDRYLRFATGETKGKGFKPKKEPLP